MRLFYTIPLLAISLASCNVSSSNSSSTVDNRNGVVRGNLTSIGGATSQTPSATSTFTLPVGTEIAKALFPSGLGSVSPSQVEAAKEAVSSEVPEVKQAAVENVLDACEDSLKDTGKCSVKAQ